jgi:DNA-binding GntR family transcriptional regulator
MPASGCPVGSASATTCNPSYTRLIDEAGMSLGVVQRAIRVRVGEGLVFTVPGRGFYVGQD